MGQRKHNTAEQRKAEKKQKAIAILRDCPTSPRKMRLVADIIRGVEINKALGILRYSKKEASIRVEKLLRSAIANWEAKNEGQRLEDNTLCVKEIFVDGGRQLKRIQPAPQGRAHRIRKRSNHVTIVVDKLVAKEAPVKGMKNKSAAGAPAAEKTVE
jgi:large subunit ribosomal protein L22